MNNLNLQLILNTPPLDPVVKDTNEHHSELDKIAAKDADIIFCRHQKEKDLRSPDLPLGDREEIMSNAIGYLEDRVYFAANYLHDECELGHIMATCIELSIRDIAKSACEG